MNKTTESINSFVERQNAEKLLFTAGPAALLPENLTGLRPCFGRGDYEYAVVESRVMGALQKMSGHANVVRMQGSASLALEVMALNFLYGRVLIVQSGYYSQRLVGLANSALRWLGQVKEVQVVEWDQLELIQGNFDWVFSCYTETSCGLKLPIEMLRANADRLSALLMIDATASIGLESRHELAEVIAYSSCKGLFGLTGAAFVAYHEEPTTEVDSFYLSLANHKNKMMTGPYHALASLDGVLADYDGFRESVVENKKVFVKRMRQYLTRPQKQQPILCTHVSCNIVTNDRRVVLYAPRTNYGGSVVCHLGDVHLGRDARGNIISTLEIME
jgi:2-aminoethylphosphonate-pyruvate transaminase